MNVRITLNGKKTIQVCHEMKQACNCKTKLKSKNL